MTTHFSKAKPTGDNEKISVVGKQILKPLSLEFAQETDLIRVSGHYDEKSQTWSDRNFEVAATKKLNEQM